MSGIFKAYDIRGRYPDEINEAIAERIGRAFVVFTKTDDIMLGRDARTHSPALAEAFIRGARAQGANVTDVGLITTSQMIAMRSWNNHKTAVMVTASHLDAPFNGFKMLTGTGQYVSANYGMDELEALVENSTFPTSGAQGTLQQANYLHAYVAKVQALAGRVQNPGAFVVDCSNGCVGPEMQLHKTVANLPLMILHEEPDGTFPNHSPNPIAPGASKQAAAAIKEHSAVGGCIFDADADRITFLDEQGNPIHPNSISCLLIERLLKGNEGDAVAYDLISSRSVPETIVRCGGKPVRTKVGRANVIDAMMRTDALFGAETSSHLMFRDTFYGETTTLVLLLVLDTLGNANKPFSQLVKPYEQYALLPETNFTIDDKDGAMEALVNAFPDAQLDRLDGVCFTFTDGWLVARASNTEPILRLRGEADTADLLKSRLAKAQAVIAACGGALAHGH
jgi:phosphomannomutase